jgi:subtilase-type serine protease
VLGGTGTVIGNTVVQSGGALQPGDGTAGSSLKLTGNLAFQSGALYLIQVSAAGAPFTSVTGTASLAGGVQVSSPTSTYKFSTPMTILTSAGLNGTKFDTLTTPTGITGALTYTPTNVQLSLTSSLANIPGENGNQKSVALALDRAFNANGSTGLLGAIFSGNILQNLQQAAGESATGSQQTTFSAMSQFLNLMLDPNGAGRGAGPAGPTNSYAEETEMASSYAAAGRKRTGSERDAYGLMTKAPLRTVYDPHWSVWAAGFGGTQTTDGNLAAGTNTTKSSVFGGAAGADYWFSPKTVAGFSLAGGGTSFSVNNNFGYGRSDLFQAGVFVRHTEGPAYVAGALAYGWQDVSTDRTVTIAGIDKLHAEFHPNTYSGRLEGGYRFVAPVFGGVGITPYAAGQFTTIDLPSYGETATFGSNAFALAYNARSVTDTRSELGVRTDKSFAVQNGVLTLRGRLAWAHDYNPDRTTAATFQALPLASFTVNGAGQAPDSVLTTSAIEWQWINGWSAGASFEGEFSNVTSSYAGKGVVRYTW